MIFTSVEVCLNERLASSLPRLPRRPKAVRMVSGVGSEEVEFEPVIPLEGKVEIYMQVGETSYIVFTVLTFASSPKADQSFAHLI